MNARIALSFTLAAIASVAVLGCKTTSDADEAEHAQAAQAEIKATYGYEYFADRLSEDLPAAPAPAQVNGRVTPEVTRDVLRSSFGALRACERDVRGEAPPGEMKLRVVVGQDGKVLRVTAEGAPGGLAECAKKAIGALQFPKSDGGAFEAVYPVLFGKGS